MSTVLSILMIIILSLETVAILVGNAFTIFVFWAHRSCLKRTCFVLINLAVADFLVGISESVILGTKKIPEVRKHPRRDEQGNENSSLAIILLGSSASVLFLALISLERVYAVLWPFRHRLANAQAYICSAVIVWAFGLCTTGLSLLSLYYPEKVNNAFLTVFINSCLIIALLVICASYLSIRTRLRSTTPQLQDMPNRSRRSAEQNLRNLRLSRTLFVVAALSIAFWLPASVVYSIREFCKTCFSPLALEIVTVLRLANSAVNPFVYTFRMPIFRNALRHCRKRQRHDFELRPVQ